MVLEGLYSAFGGVVLVYIYGYKLISDITLFLDDTRVLCADLVIDHLRVDLVSSQSEEVHYGVVG